MDLRKMAPRAPLKDIFDGSNMFAVVSTQNLTESNSIFVLLNKIACRCVPYLFSGAREPIFEYPLQNSAGSQSSTGAIAFV